MRKRLIIITVMIISFLTTGITYSLYTSSKDINIESSLASFIVDVSKTDNIDIPLSDIKPGAELVYDFSVSNNSKDKTSDVYIIYNITLNTMHLMPLDINLYDDTGNLVLTCTEENPRNLKNELECKSNDIEMAYDKDIKDNYTLKVKFDPLYSESSYADLVDYINLKVDSYQKTE